MQRTIQCAKCALGPGSPLHASDVDQGFTARLIRIIAKCPVNHGFTVNGEFQELHSLQCDSCGEEIPDGQIVWARTIWNTKREGTPGMWEPDFGQVISDDVANVAEILSKPLELKRYE